MFFSSRGTVKLVSIEGKMNGAKYRETLDENLLQSSQDLRLGRWFTFQQDTDPKHTGNTSQEWLRDQSLNVRKDIYVPAYMHVYMHMSLNMCIKFYLEHTYKCLSVAFSAVLRWDLIPIEHLWRNLKVAV
jgi:hypothetical protein